MLAFAANSVLNRMAVGAGLIGAVDYAVIRLAAGAVMLVLLVLARRAMLGGAVWPGWRGRPAGVTGLLGYLFLFSMAYLTLDAGIGALILFGSVQITMFAGALIARGRRDSRQNMTTNSKPPPIVSPNNIPFEKTPDRFAGGDHSSR